MTIFDCQKRVHEPHHADVGNRWVPCDGTPQWPYDRPKPPRGISGNDYENHQTEHGTISVRRSYLEPTYWNTEYWRQGLGWHIRKHGSHQEAVNYAHKLATERKNNGA